MKKLHYEEFESLDNREKSSFMCYNNYSSEQWESKFDGLLNLVKKYIVDVWEIQNINYNDSRGVRRCFWIRGLTFVRVQHHNI